MEHLVCKKTKVEPSERLKFHFLLEILMKCPVFSAVYKMIFYEDMNCFSQLIISYFSSVTTGEKLNSN